MGSDAQKPERTSRSLVSLRRSWRVTATDLGVLALVYKRWAYVQVTGNPTEVPAARLKYTLLLLVAVSDNPLGTLDGTSVLVTDERAASTLYNKGSHGVPESGGGLRLSLMEAAYLVDAGRLAVEDEQGGTIDLELLVSAGGKADNAFEVRYIVYRDMRERGYLVKPSTTSGVDFEVFPRGGSNKDPSRQWLLAVSERTSFETEPFLDMLHRAEGFEHRVLIGVVDEEGDVTHYIAQLRQMSGTLPSDGEGFLEGWAFEDRVLAFDLEAAGDLAAAGHLGRRMGDVHQLSLIEATHLMENGHLKLKDSGTGEPMEEEVFLKRVRQRRPDFDLRYKVYVDLREKGLVVKTGFKYGTHFRAYDRDPNSNHAQFLIHAVPRDLEISWPELSRAVRLAHGVRKEMVFGAADSEAVEYLRMRRVRP
jgi:tRNA-intron endonuclease